MKTRIVKIGNSQGVRIPKVILEQSRIGKEVELFVEHEQIIIRSAPKPRAGWNKAFADMAAKSDDHLLDDETQNVWDDNEWQWDHS